MRCMETWKSVAIWDVCWRRGRAHRRHRKQLRVTSLRRPGHGHLMCEEYSYQLCCACESLGHECGEDCPDSLLVVWGNRQDWSSPEELRPSTCLHFSGKWIIWIIVFIADFVHQALTKITCSHAAMVYHCKTSTDSIYSFQTLSPTEVRKTVAWLLAKVRFTCPTNVCEVSSKFPCCLIVVLPINIAVQVLICSDSNCGSYSPDILLWHTTNGNERSIIDW